MKKYFLVTSALLMLNYAELFSQTENNMKNMAIAIHGGAGVILKKNMSPEMEKAYYDKLNESLDAGYNILKNGGSSMDAVIAAIMIMEDSPLFNAGKGAVFTNEGTNELDASIMYGKTLEAGAVASVKTVKNPILAAKAVMENSKHVLLSGNGADEFAKKCGLEIVDPSYFRVENRWKQWQQIKKNDDIELDHSDTTGLAEPDKFNEKKFGTVGAVALDIHGNISAGTSTGGMTNKKYGRVGDSPIIGAGTYANNKTCAVSATGHGEYFIRSVVAYDISALMEYKGYPLQQAADEVVMQKLASIKGDGGVIAIDNKGNIAMPFNTDGMYRGYIDKEGQKAIKFYKD